MSGGKYRLSWLLRLHQTYIFGSSYNKLVQMRHRPFAPNPDRCSSNLDWFHSQTFNYFLNSIRFFQIVLRHQNQSWVWTPWLILFTITEISCLVVFLFQDLLQLPILMVLVSWLAAAMFLGLEIEQTVYFSGGIQWEMRPCQRPFWSRMRKRICVENNFV